MVPTYLVPLWPSLAYLYQVVIESNGFLANGFCLELGRIEDDVAVL